MLVVGSESEHTTNILSELQTVLLEYIVPSRRWEQKTNRTDTNRREKETTKDKLNRRSWGCCERNANSSVLFSSRGKTTTQGDWDPYTVEAESQQLDYTRRIPGGQGELFSDNDNEAWQSRVVAEHK